MKTLGWVKYAAKALVAGTVAFAGVAVTASADGHWTQPEVWTALGATATAVGVVFKITNGTRPPKV